MALFGLLRRQTSREKHLRSYLRAQWGVRPINMLWYEKALRHKSVIGTGKFCHNDCNERLELLGDAVLDTVVTEYLFVRFPEATEGDLTKIRSRIVNREMLGSVGMNAKLNDLIEVRIGSDDSMDKIVGNALEAWLGAIYIDKGFDITKKCVLDYLLSRYIDIEEVINQSKDFKSKLIEWAQQQKLNPSFSTRAVQEDPHLFQCEITVDGTTTASGTGRSKKRAEQQAAKEACDKLNI